MKRKRVVVLGATGSIGESALKVAHDIPERMEIVGLAANSNVEKLAAAANKVRPKAICLVDQGKMDRLRAALDYQPQIFSGEEGLRQIASMPDADMVLIAIVGTGGLRPALAAIEAGKDLAVASKEILVMAGEIVTREAREKGVNVLPVDSEHNAIFQCLEGKRSTLNAQRSTSNSDYAHYSHRLPRRRFILVFLVGAHMGGIEEALRRPRRVPVEDRAHGFGRVANFARAGAMVLPAQWNDDAVAIHAEYRLV